MKTLDADWLTEAKLLYGQDVVLTLDLELSGGTEYLSTRTITSGGNTYDPLLVSGGPIQTSFTALSTGRLITTDESRATRLYAFSKLFDGTNGNSSTS